MARGTRLALGIAVVGLLPVLVARLATSPTDPPELQPLAGTPPTAAPDAARSRDLPELPPAARAGESSWRPEQSLEAAKRDRADAAPTGSSAGAHATPALSSDELGVIVVRASDGAPLADVEVQRLLWNGARFVHGEPVSARTDGAGRCVLPKADRAARARVFAPPTGLAPEEAQLTAGRWTTLRLVQGGTVRATVLTADGRPCADVDLGFIAERGQRGHHASTPVGLHGNWTSEGRKPGTHLLTAWAAGQRWGYLHTQEVTVVAGRAVDVRVVLPSLVPLEVALTGDWPPGVEVELKRTDVDSGDDISLPAEREALRTMLVPGRWTVTLKATRMVPQSREIRAPAGHRGLWEEFMAPAGRVTFHLRDEAGTPLGAGARGSSLTAEDARGGIAWAGMNERGEATIHGLAPGACALAVYSGYGNPATHHGSAHLSGTVETLVVRLAEGGSTYTYTPTTYFPTYYPTSPAGAPRSGR